MELDRGNARAIEIWDAFLQAGLAVVEELRITEDELHAGANCLQQIGKDGFLVGLVDSVFATRSALVSAAARGVQSANLEGPLYRPGAPFRDDGVICDRPSERSAPLTITGRVYDAATGVPIDRAVLDFWQADQDGNYDNEGFELRGKVRTADDGTYMVRTIVPEAYTLHESDSIADLYALLGRHAYRAAHVHLKVWVDDIEVLTTQFFDSGSRFLDSDYVVDAVRDELIVEREPDAHSAPGAPAYRMRFDVPVTLPSPAASSSTDD